MSRPSSTQARDSVCAFKCLKHCSEKTILKVLGLQLRMKGSLWYNPLHKHSTRLCSRFLNRDAGARGQRGQAPPALEEGGRGGKLPFLCCLLIEFFRRSLLALVSVKFDLLLYSGIHHLLRNVTIVRSKCL